MTDSPPLRELSQALRFLIVDTLELAQSGHPGMPLGMADVATVLFTRHLHDDDRFVLSCGHGSLLLYAILYLQGRISLETLQSFRRLHSPCAGHPEYGLLPEVATTTGPLGQGLANAVGMAWAQREGHVYVMASDGDMMEGISHEACSFAGHHRLHRLIILYDANQITIDGPLSLACSENTELRFQAYGFFVQSIDGHDYAAIERALMVAQQSDVPSLILCRTQIAHGAPTKAGSASAHGSPLGPDEVQAMREALQWEHPPFVIPSNILAAWYSPRPTTKSAKPESMSFPLTELHSLDSAMSTRQASHLVLEQIAERFPSLIVGSADLTPSNLTKTRTQKQYIHYGVREHAMAAIANGLSLSGLRPVVATFLCFTDYLRPALRLAAMMRQPVIYVCTHDSIGVGEDGPTHQPVEHLTSLRAIPHVRVYRPCDAVETAECWQLALEDTEHPSILCLSRQSLPLLRTEGLDADNRSRAGGYRIAAWGDAPLYTWLATGSEVSLALQAAHYLWDHHQIPSQVISVPCMERFCESGWIGESQRIVVEAGHRMSWGAWLRPGDLFFGVEDFGHSAPYQEVYATFGLTVEKMVSRVLSKG